MMGQMGRTGQILEIAAAALGSKGDNVMRNTDRSPKTNWTDTARQHLSHSSPKSHPSAPGNPDGFIPPHDGYENLLSFQKARIVYDGTVTFCDTNRSAISKRNS